MSEGTSATLLVVDDEARILSALRRTLRREGYEILTAETPVDALKLLDECSVDVILSDQKMPGMSGLQLLSRAAEVRPSAIRSVLTRADFKNRLSIFGGVQEEAFPANCGFPSRVDRESHQAEARCKEKYNGTAQAAPRRPNAQVKGIPNSRIGSGVP